MVVFVVETSEWDDFIMRKIFTLEMVIWCIYSGKEGCSDQGISPAK